MSPTAPSVPDRPVLDESAFQQLLAAAFVLQEHNDQMRAQEREREEPKPAEVGDDPSQLLSDIVETQALIQGQHLNFAGAAGLIAERVQKITRASGAAVGIVEGNQLAYAAGTGEASNDVGSRVAVELSPSAECISSGRLLQVRDTAGGSRAAAEICRKRGIGSLIAVPVYHDGKVAGVLETRFSQANAFQEHQVRSCQLIAGLVTEAINRAAEIEWKQVLAAERANMLEVLERLRPQLERLTGESTEPAAAPEDAVPEIIRCEGCGAEIGAHEAFCGACGTANRAKPEEKLSELSVPVWPMEMALPAQTEPIGDPYPADDSAASVPDIRIRLAAEEAAAGVEPGVSSEALVVSPPAAVTVSAAPTVEAPAEETPAPWSSARGTRLWLESLRQQKKGQRLKWVLAWLGRVWKFHRANLYVIAAFLLLMAVVFGLGGNSTNVAGNGKAPLRPKLSFVEKTAVWLGLAVPPETPAYVGNPDTQVWVDVHTALYYCPGSDLYGSTVNGKYERQRDAQLDRFEPAARRACN